MGPHNDLPEIIFRPVPYSTDILMSARSALGLISKPRIRKVIYNAPATIILWEDGSKTVVKCSEDDIYDPMTGFLLCCLKYFLGNDSAAFHRFLKEYGPKEQPPDPELDDLSKDLIKKTATSIGTAAGRVLDAIVEAFGNGFDQNREVIK